MKFYIKSIAFSISLFLVVCGQLSAQDLPLDPAVTVGKLSNGFTYYIRKNSNQKKRVTLYLVNKVGSVLETEEQRGLAHFMEHMSFNGTTHFPGGKMVDFLEKAGVRFGADLNAYTSFDETVYQLPLALDRPDMLNSGLQVIRDWASEATLDQKEIDKERGVVLEEKRLRTGAQHRVQQQTFPYLVNHSRYAIREPIGTDEVLKNFNREAILSFYRDWYRPDLQAIVVVGDVDVKDVVEKIKLLFSDLKGPEVPKTRVPYAIELNGKNQFLTVTDKEAQGTLMQITVKYPHKKLVTHMDYLDYVKRNLFNQLMARRLQSVSQKNADAYLFANAGINPLMANVDAFTATLSARPGELEKSFGAFWKEIDKIKTSGFTAGELAEAKTNYLNAVLSAANEGDKKQSAQYAQEYTRHFLLGEAAPGVAKEAELTEAYLPVISLAHLNQMARQYMGNTNRDIFIIANESTKSNLPNEQQVEGWFTKYENSSKYLSSTEEAKEAEALAKIPLLSVLPVKGKVVSGAKINELNIIELKLSNGVRVILKPTAFKNDEIQFTGFSPGGTSLYPDSVYQSAANAAGLVAAGGIGNFTAEMLRGKLNGKQAFVSPYIAERAEGFSGYSTFKDLEIALQLTYLYFTAPRKDTAAFNANMSRSKAMLAGEVGTPEKVFSDTLSAVLSNYSNRRKSPGLFELNQINLDKAFEIYQDRFKDASDFTFVFVGNFDVDKIKPLLVQYLGSLPSINRKEEAKDLKIEIPDGSIAKTVYSGSADKATVQLILSGDYLYSPENNLQLRALKYILSLRLIERLREQEGGVYAPSVNVQLTKSPKSRYVFSIQFGCAPENADRLIRSVWEEIEKLKANGPLADDLEKFVAEEKVGVKNDSETNGFWLSYLINQYQEQLDPKQFLGYGSRLEALTASQLKTASNTYLDHKNYIRMVLLPERKSQ